MDWIGHYNTRQYKFIDIVRDIFDCNNLLILHQKVYTGEVPNLDLQAGLDQGTFFHNRFYETIRQDNRFLSAYKSFIDEIIISNHFPHRDDMMYQKIPTFRVHLPNNKSVGGTSHKDSDYNHPSGEINFLVPLTSMRGSNSVFYETHPGYKDFRFKELDPGQYWEFDGNRCEHGNIQNVTGWTRVSFDFRMISEYDLKHAPETYSIAHGLKFTKGEYYEKI